MFDIRVLACFQTKLSLHCPRQRTVHVIKSVSSNHDNLASSLCAQTSLSRVGDGPGGQFHSDILEVTAPARIRADRTGSGLC